MCCFLELYETELVNYLLQSHIYKKHITGSICLRVNYKLHVSDLQQHEPLS